MFGSSRSLSRTAAAVVAALAAASTMLLSSASAGAADRGANGVIAFAHGNGQIATLSSGGETILNPSGPRQTRPAFSSDGTRIAYISGYHLWIMNADGSKSSRRARHRQSARGRSDLVSGRHQGGLHQRSGRPDLHGGVGWGETQADHHRPESCQSQVVPDAEAHRLRRIGRQRHRVPPAVHGQHQHLEGEPSHLGFVQQQPAGLVTRRKPAGLQHRLFRRRQQHRRNALDRGSGQLGRPVQGRRRRVAVLVPGRHRDRLFRQ